MSRLCFGNASPEPDFSSRMPALVAAVALSFALNDRLRREFVLQQLVRVATVEQLVESAVLVALQLGSPAFSGRSAGS